VILVDEKKKILFVMGMEHKLENLMNQATNINPENIIILQSYGPVISQPLDDLMRDIIIAVYQENVEEIFVVATKDNQKNTGEIINKIFGSKGMQAKIQTLDYLLKNCRPEFPEGNIREWLEGSKTLKEGVQNSVNIIRHHPLMPPHVKVTELFLDQDREKRSEIEVT
jgi:carbonic anhydrase